MNDNPNSSPRDSGLKYLTAAASIATIPLAVGYFIGWSYVRAYFQEFGAGWLLPQVPTSRLLDHAEWPIALLAAVIFLAVIEKPKSLWALEKQNELVRYFGVISFLLFFASIVFRVRAQLPPARSTALLAMLLSIVVAASTARLGSLGLRNRRDRTYDWLIAFFFVGAAFIGLYWSPMLLGRVGALTDLNPKSSTLPILEIQGNGEQRQTLRLLFATDARIYAVDLEQPAPRISAVSWDRAISIRKPH